MISIPISLAYENAWRVFKKKLVPAFWSSPGLGKSTVFKQLAKDKKLKFIDCRLSQFDPTEINGFPVIQNGRSTYAPPAVFPLVGDPLPDMLDDDGKTIGKYKGWLILFDEYNSASLAVQAATYQPLLDKTVGQHRLHKNVVIACAGNLSTDRAIVNRMSTAAQSRIIHFNIEVSLSDWIDWSYLNNIDHRTRSFIEFRPDLLHKFDPKHTGNTFPCPRTWEFVSKLTGDIKQIGDEHLPLIAGTVGEGAAHEYVAFGKLFGQLPTLKQILTDPKGITMPTRPDITYAMSSLLSSNMTQANGDTLMEYINRMPPEFQVITLKTATKTNPKLVYVAKIQEWIADNANDLM